MNQPARKIPVLLAAILGLALAPNLPAQKAPLTGPSHRWPRKKPVPQSAPAGLIEIVSPDPGSALELGGTLQVRFRAPETTRLVRVRLSLDGGRSWSDRGNILAAKGLWQMNLHGDRRLATRNARVLLTDAANPAIKGLTGPLVFAPRPLVGKSRPRPSGQLRITSPIGRLHMTNNHTYTFRWEAGNAVNAVRVSLSFDDGRTWTSLQENIPAGQGEFRYHIDDTAVMHTDRGRIRVESMRDPAISDMTDRLVIQADRPENRDLLITSPSRTWTVYAGRTFRVEWLCPQRLQDRQLHLEYSLDAGQTWRRTPMPRPIQASAESVNWLIPTGDQTRTGRLRLVAADNRPLRSEVSEPFIIRPANEGQYNDPHRPEAVRLLSPRPGARVPLGGRMEIQWEAEEDIARVEIFYIPHRTSMAGDWVRLGIADADQGRFVWNIPHDENLLSRDGSVLVRNALNICEIDRSEDISVMAPARRP